MTNIIEEQKKDIESIPEKVEVLDAENKTAIDTENKAEEKKKFKKAKKQVLKGRATIKCSYNNTIINISDQAGAVLGWSSSGLMGFKG
ncbi:MAG: 30S ribosomal protein S11, partial [Candidatus Moraniibacteriota bacterium]